jgi:Flp pilus assembly protein TadG
VRRVNLRRDEGVAMTEFALIAPVFLLIVAGLLGFGRVLFYWIETNHEASEAARWAVVDRNPFKTCAGSPTGAAGCQSLQQHAVSVSTVEFKNNTAVCIDFPDGGTLDVGDPVRVRIEKPFTLIPILNVGTVTIRGSSTMRIERFATGTAPQNYATGQNIGTCT